MQMSIPRIEISDDIVELAISAPDEVITPGHNSDALAWALDQKLPLDQLSSFAVVWALSETQISLFSRDLNMPTPTSYPAEADHAVGRYGALQLLLSSTLGTPFGLPHQRNGVLLQDVFPKEGLFDRANSGLGATEAFDFHTDQAFSPDPLQRPDYVTLACIRNNERAITGIVSLSSVLMQLDKETLDQLSSNSFNVYTGRSHEGKGIDTGPILIRNESGQITIRLGGDVEGTSSDARHALSGLRQALATNATSEGLLLGKGEILGFDNSTSIHYRSSFTPESSPAKRRWIRKTYIRILLR